MIRLKVHANRQEDRLPTVGLEPREERDVREALVFHDELARRPRIKDVLTVEPDRANLRLVDCALLRRAAGSTAHLKASHRQIRDLNHLRAKTGVKKVKQHERAGIPLAIVPIRGRVARQGLLAGQPGGQLDGARKRAGLASIRALVVAREDLPVDATSIRTCLAVSERRPGWRKRFVDLFPRLRNVC
jgi:hypothetical protein